MSKLSSLGQRLTTIEDTLMKVGTEIKTLQGQLGDVELPPEAEQTLLRLEVLAKTLDDLNPDAPPPPPA